MDNSTLNNAHLPLCNPDSPSDRLVPPANENFVSADRTQIRTLTENGSFSVSGLDSSAISVPTHYLSTTASLLPADYVSSTSPSLDTHTEASFRTCQSCHSTTDASYRTCHSCQTPEFEAKLDISDFSSVGSQAPLPLGLDVAFLQSPVSNVLDSPDISLLFRPATRSPCLSSSHLGTPPPVVPEPSNECVSLPDSGQCLSAFGSLFATSCSTFQDASDLMLDSLDSIFSPNADQSLPRLRDNVPAKPIGATLPYLTPNDARLQPDVINLSSKSLSNQQLAALNATVKFRLSAPIIPALQFIAGSEEVARGLEWQNPESASRFRTACAQAISQATVPAPNMLPYQQKILAKLARDESLVIMQADKAAKLWYLTISIMGSFVCSIWKMKRTNG